MFFSNDMKELLLLFERNQVKYVLVGGFAVNYYGYVRMTQDIDVLLYPSKENAANVMISLDAFGFGNTGIPEELFEKEGSAIHLGVEPNRIDLLTRLKSPANDRIFTNALRVIIDGIGIDKQVESECVFPAEVVEYDVFHMFHVNGVRFRSPGDDPARADVHARRGFKRKITEVE